MSNILTNDPKLLLAMKALEDTAGIELDMTAALYMREQISDRSLKRMLTNED